MRILNATAALALVLVGSTAGTAQAAVVVGGGGLLTQSSANQIETWLGEGPVVFTNLYTKQTGDNSSDFHAAVDGQGRTVTLIEIIVGSGWETTRFGTEYVGLEGQVIGGYNPQDWHSGGGYNISPPDERDAFLFNLTSGVLQPQLTTSTGQWQTYNNSTWGPVFGSGHDIFINSSLTGGYAYNYSYGSTEINSIVDSPNDGFYVTFNGLVGRIEVYAVSADSSPVVPEPSSLALLAVGACVTGAGAARRRRAARQAA